MFSGLCTETAPEALPEGVSPDCQDILFYPGSFTSRYGLRKVFNTPFPNDVTISYGKSYVSPDGTIYNLYLDSTGALWVENFSDSPGTRTLIYQSALNQIGLYAKSVTADGREYIAISDGLHGAEQPLQFDGTNLYRVSQNGPGAGPNVTSVALPSTTMAVSAPPAVLTVVEADPAGGPSGGPYTTINIFVTSVGSAYVGGTAIVAGSSSSPMDGTYTIIAVYPGVGGGNGLIIGSASFPSGTAFGLGGTCTLGSGSTMVRANNVVTVETSTPNQLKVGYQAQISNVPAAIIGGSITSIVIDNEDFPGIATVTTSAANNLSPGLIVSLSDITGSTVGGSISAISRQGGIVTVTMAAAHGLNPGASITIAGVTDGTFNTSTSVLLVPTDEKFTFLQTDTDASSSGGTVTLEWPITGGTLPNYFEVLSAPSASVFTVQIDYSDGSWSSGLVKYDWQGTFFVLAVLSDTKFQYQQYGPDATTGVTGTVTPYGQAAPGKHQLRASFLTETGYLTEPSPPITFVANGGQYVNVTNIPIGPPNTVARVLQFTGAEGAYFFYIAVPAQVNGQVVSTATRINDNTTTTALLDFSDNTLFAASAVSIPGNNLAELITIDGALGFGFYGSRLMPYGQRNKVNNLLNMGFEGGYLPSAPSLPTGWSGPPGALLSVTNRVGQAFAAIVSAPGTAVVLSQPCFEDFQGDPIVLPNTRYRWRWWLALAPVISSFSIGVRIVSASTSFVSSASVSGSSILTSGTWFDLTFDTPMPNTIPTDMTLEIFTTLSGGGPIEITMDEMVLSFAETPYLNGIYGSYVNNPESFDGLTGYFGPDNDTRQVMDMGIIRNSLYLLTRDPSGRLHQTSDNGVTEPSGWTVNEVASNCGALSAYSLTRSQADDATASGGEEWFTWASSTGARIFGGGDVYKMSQEIQPNWTGDLLREFGGLDFSAALTIWSINDSTNRIIYFGVPSLDRSGQHSAPNLILPMSYRELDNAFAIGQDPAIHTSNFSGRLVATDNTRKWTRWNLACTGAAMMYRGGSQLSFTLFAGNGALPGLLSGFGNVYTLDAAKLTDDDYGQIDSYYFTYGFASRDQEQGLQLGSVRKMIQYATGFVAGVGNFTISYYPDSLKNLWPLNSVRTMVANPTYDMEFAGGNATGQRIFVKMASSPATGTDNRMAVTRLMVALRQNARLPIRGAA